MTASFSPVQTASITSGTVQTSTLNFQITTGAYAGALLRFEFDPTVYLVEYATLNIVTSGFLAGETYKVLLMKDPNVMPTLVDGALDPEDVPVDAWIFGTNTDYFTLASVTLTEDGLSSIELDLTDLTRVMCESLSYVNPWAGSIVLWLVAAQQNDTNLVSSFNITLESAEAIYYTNRDTGGPGLHSSRYDRCPITGFKIVREKMVMDGWRKILVSPDAWDPDEPEEMDWTNRDDDLENV